MTHVLKRNGLLLLLCTAISIALTGCGEGSKVVATVNTHKITEADFQGKYKQFFKLNTGMDDPDALKGQAVEPLLVGIKKQTIDFLVQEELVHAEAEKRHVTVTDAELLERYNSVVKGVGLSEKDFTQKLAKHGLSIETLKSTLKDQLLTEKLVITMDPKVVVISDSAQQQYFKAHRKLYDSPAKVSARHILIKADMTNAKEKASAEAEAKKLLETVKSAPEQFADLAKKHSADKGSATNGGELGFFSADMMVPTFSQAAFTTPVGHITPHVVASQFGFHIIQVMAAQPAMPARFESKQAEIKQTLKEQNLSAVLNKWLPKAKAQSTITYADGYDFAKTMRDEQAGLSKQIQQGKIAADKAVDAHAKQ